MPSTGIENCLNDHDIEQVKQDFINLYVTKDKTLEEVMSHFELQGIFAKRQQWKTQITRWKISKNNRAADMLFAKKKASERRKVANKDTVFLIHGQKRTVQDVDKYFQRTKRRSREIDPQTPEGIAYYTPLPSPKQGATEIPTDIFPLAYPHGNDEITAQPNDCESVMEDRYRRFSSLTTISNEFWHAEPPLLAGLIPPTELYNVERGMFAVMNHYRSGFAHLVNQSNGSKQYTRGYMPAFESMMCSIPSNLRLKTWATAESLWKRSLELLPKIVKHNDPSLLTRLLNLFLLFMQEGHLKLGQHVFAIVARELQRHTTDNEPIVNFMFMLSQSLRPMDLIETALMLAKSCAEDYLLRHNYQWYCILDTLIGLYSYRNDLHKALRYAEEITDSSGAHEAEKEDERWIELLNTFGLVEQARLSMEYGEYDRTRDILCRMEEIVNQKSDLKADFYHYLLVIRAEFKKLTGLSGEIDDLQEALQLCQARYGEADLDTLHVALRLEKALLTNGPIN